MDEQKTQPVVRAAIQSAVTKGIRDIQRDPNRSIRKLVDLGMQIGKGQHQRAFFRDAQEKLRNDRSAYYPLIASLTRNVDALTLETVALNVGYMCWTKGAKLIRAYEREHGVNVPWALFIDLSTPGSLELRALTEQGQRLGIYAYFVRADARRLDALLTTMQEQADCAFFLLAEDAAAADRLAACELPLHNVVLVPRYEQPNHAQTLERMRQKRRMVGLCLDYDDLLEDFWAEDSFLARLEGCPFLFLRAMKNCGAETRKRVQARVSAMRENPRHPVFAMDLFADVEQIDHIISDESCMMALRADGAVLTPAGRVPGLDATVQPLPALIEGSMPRVGHSR